MTFKTVAGWAADAFLVWFVIEQPVAAAHIVHNIGTFLDGAAHGLQNFYGQI